MRLPSRMIWVFALIIFIIVIMPMVFIGTHEVAIGKTESLGIAGLMEGIQKNYNILIMLLIIAISATIVWVLVISNVISK